MNPVSTNAARLAALAALAASGEPLHLPTLILFNNPIALNPTLVIGSLTECTFSGYAASAGLVFGTPYLDVNGTARTAAPSVEFISTDGMVIETIYGWALVNAGKTALYYAELLDTPVPITAGSQGVVVLPSIPYGA